MRKVYVCFLGFIGCLGFVGFFEDDFDLAIKLIGYCCFYLFVNVQSQKFGSCQFIFELWQFVQVLIIQRGEGFFECIVGECNIDDDVYFCELFVVEGYIGNVGCVVQLLCWLKIWVW